MSWQKVKLGELGEFRNGLNYSKANEGSGLKVISVKDFGDLRVPNFAELDEINPSGLNIRNSLLDAGDIIFVRSNGNKDLIGRSMFIEKAQENVSFSGFCIRFRNQSDSAHSKFLAYYFRSPVFRRTLSNLGGGTNINNLNQGVLGNFPILLPALDQQETILRTLSAYDDLIENNRRRIGLLEQAARLLYREWFVHLRFPGHETAKIVDGLPEGWSRPRLGDVCSTNKNSHKAGKLPTRLRYIDIGSVSTGRIDHATEMTAEEAPGRARRIAEDGDTIWSNVRPNLRAYALVTAPRPDDVFSTGFTVLHAETVSPYFLYLAVTTDDFVKHLENHATGVGYPAVRADDFERALVTKPTDALMAKFHEVCQPIFSHRQQLFDQNTKLTRARDLLLPRLMDGRIPV